MNRYIAILIATLFFSSLSFAQTLDDYFKMAAENNPGLQAMYKEYEAALQKVPQVSNLPDPTFSFGYFISPVETRVGPQQAKFSLTQMFPWFGTLKAQGNVAALMSEAKFQNFIEARNRLYFQVASAYYPLYELRDFVRIEQENISILESYKTIATQKFKNGTGTMVDVLRVDIMLKDAQTNLSILRDKEKPLLTTFNKLLNRSETELVQISDTLKSENLSDDYRKDSLIAANPKLKALDLKLQASQAAEIVAQKQGLPKLGIGLDYVLVGERTDISMPDNGKNVLMPMVSISIPIFRAKYNASVKESQLMQESYTLQKQEVTNTLFSEYEMVWFQVQQHLQLISLYQQQIQTSQQSLNLLFTSYGNSGKEFEEVLRMQQQLLKYQKMSATALVQYHIAFEKINYITSKSY
ncbi:MAG: TolC family protein [Bacteroidetes bacterium]|jgi:outer membrane protein TolC|nr:TolC family protein [Bacteroidota bacterium]MBU1580710.1 TolC family protein [Bacteroidota bacterium]MBU2465687.1 TolC family protein [Bacteroidota bacterium]MBU2558607.1 TolC family protein [Bacteroidota bacterium]